MSLYCGIDLHSTNSYLVVLDESDKVVLNKRVGNELERILSELEPYRESIKSVGIESTFNWYWLVDGLEDHGYSVELVNTCAAKQYEGLKSRDDKSDARWIAHMLRVGILPTGSILPREHRAVRDLLRRRSKVVRQKTATLLSMKNVIARNTGVMVPAVQLKRLEIGDCPEAIMDPHIRRAIDGSIRILQVLEAEAAELQAMVSLTGKCLPGYRNLLTVKGIGDLLALTILYETGDISRFSNCGNYASYCRCVRSEHTSNGRRKGKGNTRNGNPYLSWAFSEAAHFVIRFQPSAHRYYERKKKKTNGIIAARAVANKMSRAVFFMLRDDTIYKPELLFGASS